MNIRGREFCTGEVGNRRPLARARKVALGMDAGGYIVLPARAQAERNTVRTKNLKKKRVPGALR